MSYINIKKSDLLTNEEGVKNAINDLLNNVRSINIECAKLTSLNTWSGVVASKFSEMSSKLSEFSEEKIFNYENDNNKKGKVVTAINEEEEKTTNDYINSDRATIISLPGGKIKIPTSKIDLDPVKPTTPEIKPTTPVIPTTPEIKPTTPVIPTIPEIKPTTPEIKPTTPEIKPAIPGVNDSGYKVQKTVDVPAGLGKVHTYMGWQCITAKSSNQYIFREDVGMNFDSEGFGIYKDRYVIACTTTYGNVGDFVDFIQEDGTVIKGVIGDIKNQNDAGCNKWGHTNGRCIVEFVVDKSSWYNSRGLGDHVNPGTSNFYPQWNQNIVNVVNYGSYKNYK